MSDTAEGWTRVLRAFDDWIEYETTEFGPWTGYFSLENLQGLMDKERLSWMGSMVDEIIPGRIESCRNAGVALEDFLPYMPDAMAIETVRSMIDLNLVLQDGMLKMSDAVTRMADEYKVGGLDEIGGHLKELKEIEEDIRHHMSLYSKGFARLRSLGLEMPD
ncbi:MAG: hypothetical protein JSW61_11560 [Candidatus Thorarchaeota archaeon]|nr:MAG: hypothetical protein JSW61_11560 [Candidatus Thorarchaeota archaeon]